MQIDPKLLNRLFVEQSPPANPHLVKIGRSILGMRFPDVFPEQAKELEQMTALTVEQKATNYDTMLHVRNVQRLLAKLISMLLERGLEHDKTKMEDPELETFVKYTPMLAKVTFGSPEYQQCLKEMQPALQHHFAREAHHPEHYKNGINDMNIVDLVEMLVDWKAASMRHNDGNLRKSIEYNANKFGICPQLVKILENSVPLLEE